MSRTRTRYNPQEVKFMTDKELRSTYSRLRSIARKRAERLSRAGFDDFDLSQVFPRVKDVKGIKNLREELLDVSLYLQDVRTTLPGMRSYVDQTLKTLHEHKYNFITRENLKAFGDFMESKRALFEKKIMDSDRAAKLYEQMERLNVSDDTLQKNFGEYLEEDALLDELISTLSKMKLRNGAQRVNSTRIEKALAGDEETF